MSTGKFFASRSADGEKNVNASCQSGCSARSVSRTGFAWSPSPTDGACIHTSGRFVSRRVAAHAARRAANPRRPSSPRATFLSKRATRGAARVATFTLSRYRNEGLLTWMRACARRKSSPTRAAHRDFRRGHGVGMNTRQRQIDEYPAYLAGLHEFPIDRGEHRHGEHPACRALEIRHLVDGDRRSGRAFGAGRERILVLRATAADEQRRGEEDGRGAKADQKPDLVQMAMTPHWESALRNSAGASLGLR